MNKVDLEKQEENNNSITSEDSEHETSEDETLELSEHCVRVQRETFKGICADFNKNKLQVISTLLGIISHNYIRNYMLTGIDGVNYYGEAHLTRWNAWMHTIGMPFTIYGMVLWIPSLLRLNPKLASRLMMAMYFFYGGHYLRINIFMAAIYFFIYYLPLVWGIKYYSNTYNHNIVDNKKKNDDVSSSTLVKRRNKTLNSLLVRGLGISTTALLFQEIAGHYYGGDIPSRWEAIPNAILYAKYFSVHHLFY